MSNKFVLFFLGVLYVSGIASSILVLTDREVKQKNSSNKIDQISSLTGLNQKKDIIGLINIEGPIVFGNHSESVLSALDKPQGAEYWISQLNEAETNKNIKAILLRMNTPGGTVAASQELHAAVSRVQKSGKPVIASVADMSASGGYYMTAGVDQMFVNSGSVVGSIGVIISSIEYSDLMKKLGITANVITSGSAKDILSPYRSMSVPEKERMQTIVSGMYEEFLKVVVEGRKSTDKKIRPLADGGIYTGRQAVDLGLADQVGTFHQAVDYIKETYNLSDTEVVPVALPEKRFNIRNLLSASQKTPKIEVSLGERFIQTPFLYLYQF